MMIQIGDFFVYHRNRIIIVNLVNDLSKHIQYAIIDINVAWESQTIIVPIPVWTFLNQNMWYHVHNAIWIIFICIYKQSIVYACTSLTIKIWFLMVNKEVTDWDQHFSKLPISRNSNQPNKVEYVTAIWIIAFGIKCIAECISD